MNRQWIVLAVLPFFLITCSGCIFFYSSRKGEPIDQAAIDKLQIRQANIGVVENGIGLPDEIIPVANGTIYRYDYSKTNTFLFLIIGHSSRQEDKLYLSFDNNNILAEKKFQDKTKDLGWRVWPFGR